MGTTTMSMTVLKTKTMMKNEILRKLMLTVMLNTVNLFGWRSGCPPLEMEGVSC